MAIFRPQAFNCTTTVLLCRDNEYSKIINTGETQFSFGNISVICHLLHTVAACGYANL